jgi:hypothetical protein
LLLFLKEKSELKFAEKKAAQERAKGSGKGKLDRKKGKKEKEKEREREKEAPKILLKVDTLSVSVCLSVSLSVSLCLCLSLVNLIGTRSVERMLVWLVPPQAQAPLASPCSWRTQREALILFLSSVPWTAVRLLFPWHTHPLWMRSLGHRRRSKTEWRDERKTRRGKGSQPRREGQRK